MLDDSEGVWSGNSGGLSLVARSGTGNVPGVSGSDFLSFYSAAIENNGDVLLRASLDNAVPGTTEGVWEFSTQTEELLWRTGSGGVPDVPGAHFLALATTPSSELGGSLAMRATLAVGTGGVTGDTDVGIWSYSQATPFLIAREGDFGVPGFKFENFATPSISRNQQSVWFATLDSPSANGKGIWRSTGSTPELLARIGSGNVPAMPNANFTSLRNSPLINDAGQVVITGVVNSSELGVWLYDQSSSSLLLQETSGGMPGIANAEVDTLDDPLLNNAGQVLVRARLGIGPGGVSHSDAEGLWFLDNGGSLIARTGSGGVPNVPTANFDSFNHYALNDLGQIAVAATLQTGLGGVTSGNDTGLWLLDPNGSSQLIAREGDTLAGKTIAALDFMFERRGSSGFNNSGQLLFQATFTTGETGLFLFSSFAADFNGDGSVDGDDLTAWRAAYGQTADADANSDGLTTGADFLIWQEQFGNGINIITSLSRAVPEPATITMLLMGFWAIDEVRRRRLR